MRVHAIFGNGVFERNTVTTIVRRSETAEPEAQTRRIIRALACHVECNDEAASRGTDGGLGIATSETVAAGRATVIQLWEGVQFHFRKAVNEANNMAEFEIVDVADKSLRLMNKRAELHRKLLGCGNKATVDRDLASAHGIEDRGVCTDDGFVDLVANFPWQGCERVFFLVGGIAVVSHIVGAGVEQCRVHTGRSELHLVVVGGCHCCCRLLVRSYTEREAVQEVLIKEGNI